MSRMKVKRKNQLWYSNNRMLIGLGPNKRDIGRNPNFDAEETKLLISLWGDPKVQKTLITTHRKHLVIAKLAEKMNEYGYHRSAEEINTRIKNLKCFYNRLKKDMDIGINTGSTWKHFKAMDEIMNRSVFSVRPNEIPKPSLKYQLEVEQIEREEREKLLNDSGNADEQQTAGTTDEAMDNLEDTFGDANDMQFSLDFTEDGLINKKIKEEEDFNETSLLIPKEEPIEEDEVIFQETSNETKLPAEIPTTKLPELMPLHNNSKSNKKSNTGMMAVSSSCRTFVNCNLSNGLQTSTPSPTVNGGLTQSIIIANQANSMQATGKISLVPTNFLLQNGASQSSQIQLRPQRQPRIICSQPNATTNAGIVTSAGAGRMKVLLVNAFQNGKTTNATVSKDVTFSNPSLISSTNVHTTTVTDSNIPKIPLEVPRQGKPAEEAPPSAKDPGIDTLFNKLIVMQTENNEIQRQRLELERQRFEFERSIADKLLLALTSAFSQQQRPEYMAASNTTMNSNAEQYIAEKDNSPELIGEFSSFQLLTPKVEKID